jgi:hypothetical protein
MEESRVAPGAVIWRHRLRYFTWAFFTFTMATGGIANLLYNGMYLHHFQKIRLGHSH